MLALGPAFLLFDGGKDNSLVGFTGDAASSVRFLADIDMLFLTFMCPLSSHDWHYDIFFR